MPAAAGRARSKRSRRGRRPPHASRRSRPAHRYAGPSPQGGIPGTQPSETGTARRGRHRHGPIAALIAGTLKCRIRPQQRVRAPGMRSPTPCLPSAREGRNSSDRRRAAPSRDETENLIRKGRFKDAVKQAKLCYKEENTAENHRLLERAYFLRARQLYQLGMSASAIEVADASPRFRRQPERMGRRVHPAIDGPGASSRSARDPGPHRHARAQRSTGRDGRRSRGHPS